MIAGDSSPPALALPAKVEPVEGWALRSSEGFFMSHAEGCDGRLVSLPEISAWLSTSLEISPMEAARRVYAALESHPATIMYWLDKRGIYSALAIGGMHGELEYLTSQSHDLPAHSNADGEKLIVPAHYGRMYWEWVMWGNVKPFPDFRRMAVTHAAAHTLWGWGTVAAPVVLSLVPSEARVATVPASAGKVPMKALHPEWTGEALQKKRATLTGHDTTRQLAEITGLPLREITRREKQSRDDAEQARQAGKRPLGGAA